MVDGVMQFAHRIADGVSVAMVLPIFGLIALFGYVWLARRRALRDA